MKPRTLELICVICVIAVITSVFFLITSAILNAAVENVENVMAWCREHPTENYKAVSWLGTFDCGNCSDALKNEGINSCR